MPATGVVLTWWFNAKGVPYWYHYELEQLDWTFLQTWEVKMHWWTTGKPTGHPTQEELNAFTGTLKWFTLSWTLADYRETIYKISYICKDRE